MHYYQFNIADYRKDTTHLSMLEHGAYRQLLDWHYLDQAPIPLETEVVFRRLSARTNDERLAIEMVLKEMFERTESGYIQRRVMQEIEVYQAKAERARDNGKLGGRPKKTNVVISGNQEQTQEKANSLTNKPNNSINNIYVDSFEMFWKTYPRKDNKKKSLACWLKIKPNIDDVLRSLAWQKPMWLKDGNQFCPMPSTYINGERWNDEQVQAQKAEIPDWQRGMI